MPGFTLIAVNYQDICKMSSELDFGWLSYLRNTVDLICSGTLYGVKMTVDLFGNINRNMDSLEDSRFILEH